MLVCVQLVQSNGPRFACAVASVCCVQVPQTFLQCSNASGVIFVKLAAQALFIFQNSLVTRCLAKRHAFSHKVNRAISRCNIVNGSSRMCERACNWPIDDVPPDHLQALLPPVCPELCIGCLQPSYFLASQLDCLGTSKQSAPT